MRKDCQILDESAYYRAIQYVLKIFLHDIKMKLLETITHVGEYAISQASFL
jgi:hypothetical protein